MKRILTLLMVLVLTLSLLLSGCGNSKEVEQTGSTTTTKGNDDKKADNSSSNSSDTAAKESKSVVFPLEEQITLTAFVTTRPNVDNYDDNDFTRIIEEMTNVNLEFVVAVENQAKEKLNLLLATGDYPDIIMGGQLNSTLQMLNGSQGVLVPMNDMIEAQGENTKRIFEEFPIAEKMITMADGNIYNLPKISDCYHCKSTQKLWIYQPWLDALGLDMPTTTDEFYDVMTAFATQDPNGNGKADEIPLAGAIKGWETQVEGFLLNAFVYNTTYSRNGTEKLYVKDGQVTASYLDDGFREGMKYLQMLRSEGILAKESFTQANDGLKQMGENPEDIILGAYPGGSPMVATDMSGGRWRDYVAVPPLKGPEGVQYSQYNAYRSVQPGFSITNVCEYPEVAFAIADLLFDEKMGLESIIGREGIDWQYLDDDSLLGINGEKAMWEEIIPWSSQDENYSWSQMGNSYRPAYLRLGRYNEDPENVEVKLYKETKEKMEPYWADVDMVLPDIILDQNQSGEMLSYATTINEYVKEKVAAYIVTDIDIDADWDNFQTELEKMGVNEMLAVLQEGLDAK